MKHLDLTTLDHEAEAALHGVPGLTEVWPATQTTQPPRVPATATATATATRCRP